MLKRSIEKSLERRLRIGIKKRGGKALKLVSPNNRGASDRLVLMPGGFAYFPETKDQDKDLDPLQKVFSRMVESLGFPSYLINSEESLQIFFSHVDRDQNAGI